MKTSFKIILLVFFVGLTSQSCSDDPDPRLICGFADPARELDWLVELIEEMESNEFEMQYSYISSSRIEGETVLVKGSCCVTCNWVPMFYNCQGDRIEELDFEDFQSRDWEVVWTSSSSTCQFD